MQLLTLTALLSTLVVGLSNCQSTSIEASASTPVGQASLSVSGNPGQLIDSFLHPLRPFLGEDGHKALHEALRSIPSSVLGSVTNLGQLFGALITFNPSSVPRLVNQFFPGISSFLSMIPSYVMPGSFSSSTGSATRSSTYSYPTSSGYSSYTYPGQGYPPRGYDPSFSSPSDPSSPSSSPSSGPPSGPHPPTGPRPHSGPHSHPRPGSPSTPSTPSTTSPSSPPSGPYNYGNPTDPSYSFSRRSSVFDPSSFASDMVGQGLSNYAGVSNSLANGEPLSALLTMAGGAADTFNRFGNLATSGSSQLPNPYSDMSFSTTSSSGPDSSSTSSYSTSSSSSTSTNPGRDSRRDERRERRERRRRERERTSSSSSSFSSPFSSFLNSNPFTSFLTGR